METSDCPPLSLFRFFQSRSYSLVWLPGCMLLPSIPGVVCSHVTKFKRLSGVVDVRHATSRLVVEGTQSLLLHVLFPVPTNWSMERPAARLQPKAKPRGW